MTSHDCFNSHALNPSGAPNDDAIIVLRCLDAMLTRRRKQVTLQRAMAFVKRLSTISLHVMPNASVGILAANRATMHVSLNVCVDILSSSPRPQPPTLPEQNSSLPGPTVGRVLTHRS